MSLSFRSLAGLVLATLSVFPDRALCDPGCSNPAAAVATSAWPSITAPKEDTEVVYSSPFGWVGLNHIYASRQALTHKRRRFIPFLMPQVNSIFPFTHALEAPANGRPLFYVDHVATAPYLNDASASELHLLRLQPLANERRLETTAGASAFSFAPVYSPHALIPAKITILSNAVLTLQPEHPLADGEYLIVVGPVASNGFEFRINCLRPENAVMPRINAEGTR